MNDEEDRLDACKKAELKQREEIDKDSRQVEELKSQRLSKKQECDYIEEEVGKARRDVGAVAKDIQAAQKQAVSLEAKLETRKNERHNILMQCKMEDIAVPMLVGDLEDIVQQEHSQSDSSNAQSNSTAIYERESRYSCSFSANVHVSIIGRFFILLLIIRSICSIILRIVFLLLLCVHFSTQSSYNYVQMKKKFFTVHLSYVIVA